MSARLKAARTLVLEAIFGHGLVSRVTPGHEAVYGVDTDAGVQIEEPDCRAQGAAASCKLVSSETLWTSSPHIRSAGTMLLLHAQTEPAAMSACRWQPYMTVLTADAANMPHASRSNASAWCRLSYCVHAREPARQQSRVATRQSVRDILTAHQPMTPSSDTSIRREISRRCICAPLPALGSQACNVGWSA